VTQADVNAGQIDNTGTAAGEAPGGDPNDPNDDITDDDPLSEPVNQGPAIEIVKSSNASGTNGVGDTITYSYAVQNTGNVTLTDLSVTDPHSGLGAITCAPIAQGGTLIPGATTTCTASYTVTQADVNAGQIDNTGTAAGEAPGGDPNDPNDDITDDDPLSEPVDPAPAMVCDVDGDGDIDRRDLSMISRKRNQLVPPLPGVYDPNGDGIVTFSDVKHCIRLMGAQRP
ncbi:MAG: hypothetical protein GY764_00025, partial [Halieaceae bacterium]|nr:hypothetical protein [Halieaceae bacterium]